DCNCAAEQEFNAVFVRFHTIKADKTPGDDTHQCGDRHRGLIESQAETRPRGTTSSAAVPTVAAATATHQHAKTLLTLFHQLFDFGHLFALLTGTLLPPFRRPLFTPRPVRRTFIAIIAAIVSAAFATTAPGALICHMLDLPSRLFHLSQTGVKTSNVQPYAPVFTYSAGCRLVTPRIVTSSSAAVG